MPDGHLWTEAICVRTKRTLRSTAAGPILPAVCSSYKRASCIDDHLKWTHRFPQRGYFESEYGNSNPKPEGTRTPVEVFEGTQTGGQTYSTNHWRGFESRVEHDPIATLGARMEAVLCMHVVGANYITNMLVKLNITSRGTGTRRDHSDHHDEQRQW